MSIVRPSASGSAGKSLCVETQGREIMAVLVHDIVAEAMRLGLHDRQEDGSGSSVPEGGSETEKP